MHFMWASCTTCKNRFKTYLFQAIFQIYHMFFYTTQSYRNDTFSNNKKMPFSAQLIKTHEKKKLNSVSGLIEAHAENRIASFISVESGHSIGTSLAVLRMFHRLGAVSLTLTHNCNTPWWVLNFIFKTIHANPSVIVYTKTGSSMLLHEKLRAIHILRYTVRGGGGWFRRYA